MAFVIFLLYTSIFFFSILLLLLFLFSAQKHKRTSRKSPVSHAETVSNPLPVPSIQPKITYDVYLAYRWGDTSENFVGHLYDSLNRYGIRTYNKNNIITPEHFKAIEESRFSIVIFSEFYATSHWCLVELVKIVETQDRFGQIVVPVFYNVDPSHVRNQTGSFKTAFEQHEMRNALKRVASISGFDSRNRDESMIIHNIVREISDKLFSDSSTDHTKLVGMDYHMEQIQSLFGNDSDDVLMIGIWGMGGIGKTTISRVYFDRFSRYYEGRCYFANLKDVFREHEHDLISLQKRLLSDTLLDKDLSLQSLDGGRNVIKERLSHKKVFIVLDDVDNIKQLETFAGKHDWFGSGSRIIITTKNRHLLVAHGVDVMYKVESLKEKEALQLFKQYAFKRDNPSTDYLSLSDEFVSYAKGLPLALKVLGSFLHRRTILEWGSELEKLRKVPNAEIQDVLRISFDGLDNNQKAIFLDIACFFKGENIESAAKIFESCNFFPNDELNVLVDKSLITISGNMLFMHDLLQEMGWAVVHQESITEPGKRSRLWLPEDVRHVLKNNTGTAVVEAIFVDLSRIKDLQLNSESFKGMYNLRLLKIYSSNHYQGFEESCNMRISGSLEFLPDKLCYLYWYKYPLERLPCNFQPENLIELNMPYSKVEQSWHGTEDLKKLRRMELGHSQNLNDIGDLSQAQNLELLNLEGCVSLQEIHPSIKHLENLIVMSLKDCKILKSLPEISTMTSLEDLILSGCSYVEKLPELPGNLKHLRLDLTAVEELPQSIKYLHKLVTLSLEDCKFLLSLPEWISSLKSLKNLKLSGCSKITELPNNFGDLSSLMKFDAKGISINRLPPSIISCRNLVKLSLRGCKGEDGAGLILPPLWGLVSLKKLNLSECNIAKLPNGLVNLLCLEELNLSRNNFRRIDASFEELSNLSKLKLKECKLLESIPKLPSSINILNTYKCDALEVVSSSMSKRVQNIELPPDTVMSGCTTRLVFTNCYKLNLDSVRNLMNDVHERLQVDRKASLGLTRQRIQAAFGVNLIYPGSEIPDWFLFQSMESSIFMELHPQPAGSIFIGFMVSAVVEFIGCSHDQDFALKYSFVLENKDGAVDECETHYISRWFDGKSSINSDHVLIGYAIYLPAYCKTDMYTKAGALVFTTNENDSKNIYPLECCKVKKCGFYPIFL